MATGTKQKKPKKRWIINTEIKPEAFAALKQRAAAEDRTLSALYRRAINEFLARKSEHDSEARDVA